MYSHDLRTPELVDDNTPKKTSIKSFRDIESVLLCGCVVSLRQAIMEERHLSSGQVDSGVRIAIRRGCQVRLAILLECTTTVLLEWVHYAWKSGQIGMAIYMQNKHLEQKMEKILQLPKDVEARSDAKQAMWYLARELLVSANI